MRSIPFSRPVNTVQWIPLKKTTLGQPKVVFITDWSLYPK